MKKFILTTTAVLALSAGMAHATPNPDRLTGDRPDVVITDTSQTLRISTNGYIHYFTPIRAVGQEDAVVINQLPNPIQATTEGYYYSSRQGHYWYVSPAAGTVNSKANAAAYAARQLTALQTSGTTPDPAAPTTAGYLTDIRLAFDTLVTDPNDPDIINAVTYDQVRALIHPLHLDPPNLPPLSEMSLRNSIRAERDARLARVVTPPAPSGPVPTTPMFLESGTAPGFTWDEYRGPLPPHAREIDNFDQVTEEGVYHLPGLMSEHRVYDAVTPPPAPTAFNAAELLEQVATSWEGLNSDPVNYAEAIAVTAADIPQYSSLMMLLVIA